LNESGFKQRLIGAAVLIALAVLFLPIILDGKKAQYFEQDLIPERPVEGFADLAASLEANSKLKTQNAVNKASTPTPTNINNSKGDKLTGKEIALIVQVASFADANNAKQLVERLKSQKLKAFVGREKVKRDGKLLSRVLIGPMLKKSEADAVLLQLKKNHDLKPSIVKYDPVNHFKF